MLICRILTFLKLYLQAKEANLFQPAREFLPMIDEVRFLFSWTLRMITSSSVFITPAFPTGLQVPIGSHKRNRRRKHRKQQVLRVSSLPQRRREGNNSSTVRAPDALDSRPFSCSSSMDHLTSSSQDWELVARLVNEVLEAFPGLKVTNGRMVIRTP